MTSSIREVFPDVLFDTHHAARAVEQDNRVPETCLLPIHTSPEYSPTYTPLDETDYTLYNTPKDVLWDNNANLDDRDTCYASPISSYSSEDPSSQASTSSAHPCHPTPRFVHYQCPSCGQAEGRNASQRPSKPSRSMNVLPQISKGLHSSASPGGQQLGIHAEQCQTRYGHATTGPSMVGLHSHADSLACEGARVSWTAGTVWDTFPFATMATREEELGFRVESIRNGGTELVLRLSGGRNLGEAHWT